MTTTTPAQVIPFDQMTRNDLENEINYLRESLCLIIQPLQNLKDNIEAKRMEITVLDDGAPHAGNMDTGIAALINAKFCLDNTRHI